MDALEEPRIGWDDECEWIGVDVVILWRSLVDILSLESDSYLQLGHLAYRAITSTSEKVEAVRER